MRSFFVRARCLPLDAPNNFWQKGDVSPTLWLGYYISNSLRYVHTSNSLRYLNNSFRPDAHCYPKNSSIICILCIIVN